MKIFVMDFVYDVSFVVEYLFLLQGLVIKGNFWFDIVLLFCILLYRMDYFDDDELNYFLYLYLVFF